MTVRRGEAWGSLGPLPAGTRTAAGDAEAAALVGAARRAGAPLPDLRLTGGDLWRTCGGPSRPPGGPLAALPVDLGLVVAGGVEHVFLAHAVARRRLGWWHGPVVAWMNAQYRGRWDVAPRAHPGDGRLHRVEASALGVRDRWKAWRRLPSGAHLPHPGISVRAVERDEHPGGVHLWLDGVPVPVAGPFEVRCLPDALTVYV